MTICIWKGFQGTLGASEDAAIPFLGDPPVQTRPSLHLRRLCRGGILLSSAGAGRPLNRLMTKLPAVQRSAAYALDVLHLLRHPVAVEGHVRDRKGS
jgi:hypothetical protein